MKNTDCLSEQDLTLHYYKELPPDAAELAHLSGCQDCLRRYDALHKDLGALPVLTGEADSAAGTRMAARVSERLNQRRTRWLPILGGSAAAAVALVVTLVIWPSQPNAPMQAQPVQTASHTMGLEDDMPDLDFLNDLELLKELDLLRQIEGV